MTEQSAIGLLCVPHMSRVYAENELDEMKFVFYALNGQLTLFFVVASSFAFQFIFRKRKLIYIKALFLLINLPTWSNIYV